MAGLDDVLSNIAAKKASKSERSPSRLKLEKSAVEKPYKDRFSDEVFEFSTGRSKDDIQNAIDLIVPPSFERPGDKAPEGEKKAVTFEDIGIPTSKALTPGNEEYAPIDYVDPFKATDDEFKKAVKEGRSTFFREMARVFLKPENIPPFISRAGAGIAKGLTFGNVDYTPENKAAVEELGEQWLRESDLPEKIGEIQGELTTFAIGTPIAGKIVKYAGKGAQRLAPFIFGQKNFDKALKAAQQIKGGINSMEILEGNNALQKTKKIVEASLRAAPEEALIGAGYGAAKKPGEGETRLENLKEDALLFGGTGALVRGALKFGELRRGDKVLEGITKIAEKEGISNLEAAKSLLKANPKLQSLKELSPKTLEQLQSIDDVAEPAKDFVSKFLIKEEAGRNVLVPTNKLLEKAGKWFFDEGGLKLPGGITVDTSGKTRRFLFDANFKKPKDFIELSRLKETQAQILRDEAAEFGIETQKFIKEKASQLGVSEKTIEGRVAQVFEGGLSKDPDIMALGQKYKEMHDPLQRSLQELDILGDTRFTQGMKKFGSKEVDLLNDPFGAVHVDDHIKEIQRARASSKQGAYLLEPKTAVKTAEKDLNANIEKITSIFKRNPDFASRNVDKKIRDALLQTTIENKEASKEFLKAHLEDFARSQKKALSSKDDLLTLVDKIASSSQFVKDTYNAAGKEHLKRFYSVHAKGRKAALGFFMRQNAGAMDTAQLSRRQDLSKEVRQGLGEIESVAYRAGQTIYDQVRMVQKGQVLKAVSMNPEWAIKKGSASAKAAEEAGFSYIPNDEKWGALAGHYVHPSIADDLKPVVNIKTGMDSESTAAFKKAYKASLQAWKYGKVVLNPSTHFRNMMSNSVLLDMSGVPLQEQGQVLYRAAQELKNKGAFWKEARAQGLFGNEFISKELMDLAELHLKDSKNPTEGLQKFFNQAASGETMSRLQKAGIKLGNIYQLEDQLFKLGKYLHVRAKGYEPKIARQQAEKWLFNYSDIPQSVKLARDYYSPFITFTAKAAPRFFETMIERPWILAKHALVFNGIANIAADGDAEDGIGEPGPINTLADFISDEGKTALFSHPQFREEIALPEYVKSNLSAFGFPKGFLPESVQKKAQEAGLEIPRMVRLPFKDEAGRHQYLDLTFILPYGDMGEPANRSVLKIPNILFPQNPILNLAEAFRTNQDPFLGTEITNKASSSVQQAKDYMNYIGRTLVPSLAPGGYSWDKIMNAAKGATDYQGRARSLPIAAMDVLLGLKLRPFDIEEERGFRIKEKMDLINQAQIGMKKVAKDVYKKVMSPEEGDKMLKMYQDQIEEIGKEMGVISTFGGE